MDQTHLITHDLKDVLNNEITQNLSSLGRVDLICAYIKTTGLNELMPFFEALAAQTPPVLVRIFTTSQFGLSDPEAIHQLAYLPNVKIKVFKASYPTFHAKGWLFIHRDQTANVAIVGSSNMSSSAIETGLEWNVGTTAQSVVSEFREVFDSYWSGEHPAFRESNVLHYEIETCDWDSLCELFPSEVEPECSDNTGSCGHFKCRKLNQELSKLETRKKQILDDFKNGRTERSRKRSKPPSNPWKLLQDAPPSERPKVIHDVRDINPNPSEDLTETGGDSQIYSTSNSFKGDLYMAVLRNDESTAEMMIKKVKHRPSVNLYLPDVPDVVLKEARKKKVITPLDVHNLHDPLLFAIAFSDSPNIVRMVFEEAMQLGRFRLISRPDLRESIFHVLARLEPQKAYAIFRELRKLPRLRALNPDNYDSPDTALAIARHTSQASKTQDKSFVEALASFLDSRNSGFSSDPPLRTDVTKSSNKLRKKRYQAPEPYSIAKKDTISWGIRR